MRFALENQMHEHETFSVPRNATVEGLATIAPHGRADLLVSGFPPAGTFIVEKAVVSMITSCCATRDCAGRAAMPGRRSPHAGIERLA